MHFIHVMQAFTATPDAQAVAYLMTGYCLGYALVFLLVL